MTRYLVVANQTIGGVELMDEVRRRITSGPSSFFVLVPTMPLAAQPPVVLAAGDTGVPPEVLADLTEVEAENLKRAEMISQSRLSELVREIRAEGVEADGEVGRSDPFKAIEETIARSGFDEIIISTLPEGVSRWLRMDVPNRAKRKFKVPVTTVTAKR